jgi:hypothetical protein
VDPYCQHTPFQTRVCCLTGFATRTLTGYYGHGRQVQSSTVTGAITAIGAFACNDNPTKVIGSETFLLAILVMIDGYTKADQPTKKMLPVEADVLELMVKMDYGKEWSIKAQAVGDLALIAFYYLLRIEEYTVKGKWNESKQTVWFKLEDVSFFKKNKWGNLVCLPKKHSIFIHRYHGCMERGLCAPGGQWRSDQLLRLSLGSMGNPLTGKLRFGEDVFVRLLCRWEMVGGHGQRY